MTSGTLGRVPPPSPAMAPGASFGAYRLIRLLGEGGFAQVWEAERQGVRVALKVLHGVTDAPPEALVRFAQEGRLAATLSHPRCVYVFSAEPVEGYPAITMEIAGGGTLQDRLDRDGPRPVGEAVDAVLDVLEGLEAAERLAIVHRDIKPSNCFVDDAGRVKIGDFGISRDLVQPLGLTQSGALLGTPLFSSPEQLRTSEVDARSDQYSVGATLYALLTGEPPLPAKSLGELIARSMTETPRRIEGIPRDLDRLLQRMLHKDPARRFPSHAAARAALQPFGSRASAPARVVDRLGAIVVDLVLVAMLLIGGMIVLEYGAHLARAQVNALLLRWGRVLWPVLLAAFIAMEWRGRGTPGKWLLGVRVTGAHGGAPGLARAALRTGVFFAPWTLLIYLPVAWTNIDLVSLVGLACPAVMFVTARRHNGYAALHDLVSGTRAARAAAAPAEIVLAVESRDTASGAATSTHQDTPYRLVRRLWSTPGESLTLAVDPALRREVWIHERLADSTSPRVRPDPAGARPARLRWLRGGEHDGAVWEAFEAPSGAPLTELVRLRGPLSWASLHRLLLELSEELAAENSPGASASLAHLWVDVHGRLRVLDFPWSLPDGGVAGESARAPDWRELTQQTVVLSLDGAWSPRPGAVSAHTRAPLPGGASALLDDLWAGTSTALDPARFHAALAALSGEQTVVSWWRRAVGIGIANALPILTFLGRVSTVLQPGSASRLLGIFHGTVVPSALGAVPALALAWAFRGGPLLHMMGLMVQGPDGRTASRGLCLKRAAWAAAPALLWAIPYVVGGALLAIRGEFGETYRHAIGWSPSMQGRLVEPLYRFFHVTFAEFCRSTQLRTIVVLAFGTAMQALLVVGFVYAVVRPERSLPDRLAGTRIVPR